VAGVTITPRTRMVSAPYTLKAADADKLDGSHAAAFEQVVNKGAASGYAGLNASSKLALGTVDQGGASSGQVLTWSGTAWAPATPSSGVTGSGTSGYLARWTGSTSLGDGSVRDGGSGYVAVGTTPNSYYGVYSYYTTSNTYYAGVYGYGYYNGVYGYASAYGCVGGLAIYNNGYPTGVYGYAGSYYGVYGYTSGSSYAAVYGYGYYYGVVGYASAYGVYGQLGTYGNGYPAGVYGYAGSYYGVYGYSGSSGSYSGVYGYGYYYGVQGYCAGGFYGQLGRYYTTPYAGVYGYNGSYSGTSYCGVYGYGYGVGTMGYCGYNGAWGCLGYGPGTTPYAGVYGYNGSGSGYSYMGVYGYGYYVGTMGYCGGYGTYGALGSYNNGYPCGVYGYGGSYYGVYAYNAYGYYAGIAYSSYGIISNGTKSCVIATSSGTRAMYCPEAPEVLFEDVGSAQLVNGYARIDIQKELLEGCVINEEHPMRAFVTATGTTPVAMSVKCGTSYFEVYGPSGANVSFDWRIVASRKGFQDKRLDLVDFPVAEPKDYIAPTEPPAKPTQSAPVPKAPEKTQAQPNVNKPSQNQ
jgi:hypothetical protein